MVCGLIYSYPLFHLEFYSSSILYDGKYGGNNGRNPMSFGRKAKAANKEDIKVRFSDVAGAEEEKQELVEVVELKDPKRFTKLEPEFQQVSFWRTSRNR